MSYRIINPNTGEVVIDKNIPEYQKWYDFDSGEEALLELIVRKECLTLADNTIGKIKAITIPLKVHGVLLSMHFIWRKYIFAELGRIFSYVGEMQDIQSTNEFEEQINEKLATNTKSLEIVKSPLKEKGEVELTHIYLLYCDDTPNIYYVGQTRNMEARFQTHQSRSYKNTKLSPKEEWIKYIRGNNYELKYKILESVEYCGDREYQWIKKYYDVKENVMLNFTTPSEYSTSNVIFLHRFRACLYEKKIIVVDNYQDVSQIINDVTTNAERYSVVAELYCEERPYIIYIIQTQKEINARIKEILADGMQESTSGNKCKSEWLRFIRDNNYELKYNILEKPATQSERQIKIDVWIKEYSRNPNYILLNHANKRLGRETKENNIEFITRFKEYLYGKKIGELYLNDLELERKVG